MPRTIARQRRRALLLMPLCLLLAFAVSPAPAAAATAPYAKLELLALRLVNCTRTGGWVRTDGTCKDYGTGKYSAYRKPLMRAPMIASKLARPYAIKIARAKYCNHDYQGRTIYGAFIAAGYDGKRWGESLACGRWKARQTVIRTHLMMQSEKSYNGWHWRNMKNPDFDRVGIGVAVVGAETRIVQDFFHP